MFGYIKDRLLMTIAAVLMILLPIVGFQVVGILGDRAALAALLMVILIIFNWIDNILLKSENQRLHHRLNHLEEKLAVLTIGNQPLSLNRSEDNTLQQQLNQLEAKITVLTAEDRHTLQQRLNQLETKIAVLTASDRAPTPIAPENQSSFKVVLQEFPSDRKIAILKEVRSITGLGLREVKDLIESTPAFVKVGLSRSEAEKIQQQLADAEAIVLIAHH
jgi:ribosomal protein L7/L12